MIASLWMALGILSSSFFGSWHCAGMCGPIASLMGQRKDLFSYHLGRFISYSALGILAGSLGQFFLNSQFVLLRLVSAILFALILILKGLHSLFPEFALKYLPTIQSHRLVMFIKRLQKFHVSQSGLTVGLLTALLPCGWLYTYVTAAIATQSPWSGGLIMILFWLGSLPALSVLPAMVRKSIQVAPHRQRKIAGVILVVAGVYSVVSFVFLHG